MEKSCLRSGGALVIPDMILIWVTLRALFRRSSHQNYCMRNQSLCCLEKEKSYFESRQHLVSWNFPYFEVEQLLLSLTWPGKLKAAFIQASMSS